MLDGQTRRGEQTVVQGNGRIVHLVGSLLIGDQVYYQLFQQTYKGQEHQSDADIEGGVEVCDAALINGKIPEGEGGNGLDGVDNNQENTGADDVEGQMHRSGTLGVFGGTDGGKDRGNAGADVLTENDRNCRRPGDDAGGAESLQDTDGSRRGLDNGSDAGTHQNTDDRIGEGGKQAGKFGRFAQRADSGFHVEHTGEEDTEAQEDFTQGLVLLFFAHHDHENTDDADHRSQGCGLEEHEEEIIRAQIREPEDMGGNGSTDIGAHDNADGLPEFENPGIDQADHDHCGSRGGLNGAGNQSTQQNSLEYIVGQFFQSLFQTAAGEFFQAAAQHGHTIQKQGKSTQQGNDHEEIHGDCSFLFTWFDIILMYQYTMFRRAGV